MVFSWKILLPWRALFLWPWVNWELITVVAAGDMDERPPVARENCGLSHRWWHSRCGNTSLITAVLLFLIDCLHSQLQHFVSEAPILNVECLASSTLTLSKFSPVQYDVVATFHASPGNWDWSAPYQASTQCFLQRLYYFPIEKIRSAP